MDGTKPPDAEHDAAAFMAADIGEVLPTEAQSMDDGLEAWHCQRLNKCSGPWDPEPRAARAIGRTMGFYCENSCQMRRAASATE